ncbi:MAG: threonylcarbamoyl-AMP synthase [Propionibacteriaceae bacterium]|jgi:tRNA threonylcarbamoyl adenosine modification protein (Sua5/YciO/YrdC/YwlC family)|nr:threonylcarbamoyl-AMP synthase [Propionibacteriaceae bacterium]
MIKAMNTDPGLWARARQLLERGELVVIPTDTVYGIAAIANNPEAVARLQNAKGRSDGFPPPVLVADAAQAWWLTNPPSVRAGRLAAAFWPGPLTLVLPTERRDLSLAGKLGTLGIRVPAHAQLCELLALTGPLAVSSANQHDQPAATTIDEAIDQLGAAVSLYVDDGPTPGPAPSTVVDCSASNLRILRVGLISEDEILLAAGGADA